MPKSHPSKKRALLVGCNHYESSDIRDLKFCNKDVDDLYECLVDSDIGRFPEEQVERLYDADTRTVSRSLFSLLQDARPNELILFFFSGHGFTNESGKLFLGTKDTDPELLIGSALSSVQIREALNECRSKRICFILDCCYSGAFSKGSEDSVDVEETLKKLDGKGVYILASTLPRQTAKEDGALQNGVFTARIVEGLKTGAPDENNDGWITPRELYVYAANHAKSSQATQIPSIDIGRGSGGEYEIALSKVRREQWLSDRISEADQLVEQNLHSDAITLLQSELKGEVRGSERDLFQNKIKQIRQLRKQVKEQLAHSIWENRGDQFPWQTVTKRIDQSGDELFSRNTDPDSEIAFLQQAINGAIQPEFLLSDWNRRYDSSDNSSLGSEVDISESTGGAVRDGGKHIEDRKDDKQAQETDEGKGDDGKGDGGKGDGGKGDGGKGDGGKGDGGMPARILKTLKGRVLIPLGILVSGIVLFLLVDIVFPSDTVDISNIRVGFLVRPSRQGITPGSKQVKRDLSVFLKGVNQRLGQGESGIQFADDPDQILTVSKPEKLSQALESGQIDVAGELSPFWVVRLHEKISAKPFIVPAWGQKYQSRNKGKEHYSSVIFTKRDFVEPGASVNKKWRSVLRALKQSTDPRMAVLKDTSTSGYWYPRKEVLAAMDAQKSFQDISETHDTPDEIFTQLCGDTFVAGATPGYRFKSQYRCPGRETDEVDSFQIIKSIDSIPYGAFVVASEIDTKLTESWRSELMNALLTEQEQAVEPGSGYLLGTALEDLFSVKWLNKSYSYYAEVAEVVGYTDVKASESERRQRQLIAVAAILAAVLIVVLIVLQRVSKRWEAG